MDKWNESFLIAKKNLKKNIYSLSQFEGINATIPETETILEVGKSRGVDEFDINIILNLKRAWNYILNNPTSYIDDEYIKEINAIVARNQSLSAGNFRGKDNLVSVFGVKEEIKPLTDEERCAYLKEINNIKNPKERALEYLVFGITSQMFWDGNKRTSFLMSNAILINENIGVLNIDLDDLDLFNKSLSNYYNEKNEDNKNILLRVLEQNIEYSSEYANVLEL
ncbi:Fic family protein [Williamsoniiplasma luminosum]|uniref:Fido domain-containing protein n=1 Tax=Williamsoniiplasma luminosum TaxID=214888 RepID=A0A2S0NKJ8_9MOLU|nr:Fic family protein [Williamsoniiplasma luminosum]AVP49540.1 MAG: hypothetical protein C5T88_03100 [Williamsoniiplasma luminosum]